MLLFAEAVMILALLKSGISTNLGRTFEQDVRLHLKGQNQLSNALQNFYVAKPPNHSLYVVEL